MTSEIFPTDRTVNMHFEVKYFGSEGNQFRTRPLKMVWNCMKPWG